MNRSLPSTLARIARESGGLLLLDKPSGIATHRPDPGKPGFAEYLEEAIGAPLKVCHRLDKETSGALVMAFDDEAARLLGAAFEGREVEKEYFFVTDRPPGPKNEIQRRSFIRKYRGRFVSWTGKDEPNAVTRFTCVSRHGRFSLWRAAPETGKPHQIRLHAHDLGIPILGDRAHGGTRFPRVMLHASRIAFEWKGETLTHRVETPALFAKPELCGDAEAALELLAGERALLPSELSASLTVLGK